MILRSLNPGSSLDRVDISRTESLDLFSSPLLPLQALNLSVFLNSNRKPSERPLTPKDVSVQMPKAHLFLQPFQLLRSTFNNDSFRSSYSVTPFKMCYCVHRVSATCNHSWLVLKTPCGAGRNLSNCASFSQNRLRPRSQFLGREKVSDDCPECNHHNKYDGEKIRMIERVAMGWELGERTRGVRAESRAPKDGAIVCLCCSIM